MEASLNIDCTLSSVYVPNKFSFQGQNRDFLTIHIIIFEEAKATRIYLLVCESYLGEKKKVYEHWKQ